MGYDFELKYRPSENMGHADGLSRLIARSPSDTEDIVVSSVEAEVSSLSGCLSSITRYSSNGKRGFHK